MKSDGKMMRRRVKNKQPTHDTYILRSGQIGWRCLKPRAKQVPNRTFTLQYFNTPDQNGKTIPPLSPRSPPTSLLFHTKTISEQLTKVFSDTHTPARRMAAPEKLEERGKGCRVRRSAEKMPHAS